MQPDPDTYAMGSPIAEYQHAKHYEKTAQIFESNRDSVSNHDLLLAILLTGESLFQELRAIRTATERLAP